MAPRKPAVPRLPLTPGVPSPEFEVTHLLETKVVGVRDVSCRGTCRHRSAEECARGVHLVFPYRGAYVRHVGEDEAVADSSQVLFFNPQEGYRVSHPVAGGDASLDLAIDEAFLRELVPESLLRKQSTVVFQDQSHALDPRAQALVALLRHSLHQGIAETLEAESLALTLVRRALGPRSTPGASAAANGRSVARRRLVHRIKLALATDLSRRWTLAEIAAEVGGSPVYLTQVFQQVEGVPLYRYQLGLRLARALDLLSRYDDLTTLAIELGFSSHSHFSAAFQRAYRRSPSEFRQSAFRR